MIYTVTLNPSLDYTADAESFNFGKTNRVKNEYFVVGGKGINVSILLKRLGLESTSLGYVAGFTGNELKRQLESIGCKTDFISIPQGFTRINMKMVMDNKVTEFNSGGHKLTEEYIEKLISRISDIEPHDTLILSGSIPSGVKEDIYKRLIKAAPDGVTVILDTNGKALVSALDCRPFLIKPNRDELSEIFSKSLESLEDITYYAKKLQEMGARNVLVSMDSQGAMLLTERCEVHFCEAPKGEVINTVGAGDSMVAGFIYEYANSGDFLESLKFAVSSGSATAYSKWLAEKKLILKIYENI